MGKRYPSLFITPIIHTFMAIFIGKTIYIYIYRYIQLCIDTFLKFKILGKEITCLNTEVYMYMLTPFLSVAFFGRSTCE